MRRLATVLAGTAAVLGAFGVLAPSAGAVVDPVATVQCLAATPADITGLIDPAAPAVPSEIPATGCLAP
ncbi:MULTISPECIES: hypothetical protein [Streptomyces]|uniref:Chaplin domain-containing protein n=2 Tax=Streptomyces TaxID=1883 RepID=A0A117IVL9_9ACTN|nr:MULTISPECIES: hypothetical protein [Streptomyces]KUH37548.1 hypothetical protein ATE80_17755 [Streptomyces kanasensis]UUS30484.1 hypothetical protein NRO40_06330 [Streptomyces changanensis]